MILDKKKYLYKIRRHIKNEEIIHSTQYREMAEYINMQRALENQ